MRKISLIFLILLFANNISAQEFYRFSAEYSVKYKEKNGTEMLKLGKVFYDFKQKQIVIKNGFPVKEIFVYTDTTVYQLRNDRVVNKEKIIAPVEFSIFHLALNEQLRNYGLDKAGYILDTVKRDKGLIIALWKPPVNFQNIFGNVLVSTKEKQLFGIVFLNTKGDIVSKHFFRNYQQINGFSFPTEVVRMNYIDDFESYETTTYKKIIINDTENNEYYNYDFHKK
ncbi:MAG: hypothetical protein JXR51_06790 [Bacteroidales bacterium]|nr:hypothetical protein [Bacteroidales bacterium]MBN2756870.1 hypothetical protein [Bacteroidales bacterium]